MIKLKSLISYLRVKKITIAAVESVSGGYLSYLLTKIPGSSKVFKGSVIAYSLEAKNKFFKVPAPLLKKTQGVSYNVAKLLATRARKLFKVDIALSIVGFAGPEIKPGVNHGTMFMAISDKNKVIVKKILIKGNRDYVRKKSSALLLELLYNHISKNIR